MKESWASSDAVRANMRANRSRDTKPELRVRQIVHSLGLRYRVAARPLSDCKFTADLVFTRARVAVFVDGCFWHACPEHYRLPKTHRDYWAKKAEGNQARDRHVVASLVDAGWIAMRFWEHENPTAVAQAIQRQVVSRSQTRWSKRIIP
ncbi:very short patch repair endonuclease [Rhodococcus sp. NPDC056743]|uniref:very short patch repair endonuclease n=1 Tax=Rhodococcus sp. NPDC056743 TaxID=3345934 RepID=UPI0036733EF4